MRLVKRIGKLALRKGGVLLLSILIVFMTPVMVVDIIGRRVDSAVWPVCEYIKCQQKILTDDFWGWYNYVGAKECALCRYKLKRVEEARKELRRLDCCSRGLRDEILSIRLAECHFPWGSSLDTLPVSKVPFVLNNGVCRWMISCPIAPFFLSLGDFDKGFRFMKEQWNLCIFNAHFLWYYPIFCIGLNTIPIWGAVDSFLAYERDVDVKQLEELEEFLVKAEKSVPLPSESMPLAIVGDDIIQFIERPQSHIAFYVELWLDYMTDKYKNIGFFLEEMDYSMEWWRDLKQEFLERLFVWRALFSPRLYAMLEVLRCISDFEDIEEIESRLLNGEAWVDIAKEEQDFYLEKFVGDLGEYRLGLRFADGYFNEIGYYAGTISLLRLSLLEVRLRRYFLEHGHFPKSLSEVGSIVNPITGKEFNYECFEDSAVIVEKDGCRFFNTLRTVLYSYPAPMPWHKERRDRSLYEERGAKGEEEFGYYYYLDEFWECMNSLFVRGRKGERRSAVFDFWDYTPVCFSPQFRKVVYRFGDVVLGECQVCTLTLDKKGVFVYGYVSEDDSLRFPKGVFKNNKVGKYIFSVKPVNVAMGRWNGGEISISVYDSTGDSIGSWELCIPLLSDKGTSKTVSYTHLTLPTKA